MNTAFFCTHETGHSSPVLSRSHIAVNHKKKRSLTQPESGESVLYMQMILSVYDLNWGDEMKRRENLRSEFRHWAWFLGSLSTLFRSEY